MATYRKKTPLVAPDDAKQRHDLMDKAIFNFTGSLMNLKELWVCT